MNEKMLQVIRELRPIDDIFFEVLAQDKEVCQEILRTILEDDALVVISVTAQDSVRNLYGRSVRLDALCTLRDGAKVNIEIQRSNKDNHLKRVRFHASCITAEASHTGNQFEQIPDVYVVYISEFDFFKKNKVIYHIDSVIRETGETVDDGQHEIFVNTAVKDSSDISALMQCFMQSNPKETDVEKFPKISERMRMIKETEGGREVMCELMEKYAKEMVEEGREEGRVEGRAEGVQEGLLKGRVIAYYSLALPVEEISEKVGITCDEVEKIIAENDKN